MSFDAIRTVMSATDLAARRPRRPKAFLKVTSVVAAAVLVAAGSTACGSRNGSNASVSQSSATSGASPAASGGAAPVGTAPAAGGGSAAAGKDGKIALVAGGPNVFFDSWRVSAQTAQTDYSIPTVTYVVPPTQTFETAVEITTLNGLVAQGYNAMAVFPDGAEAIRPTYARIAASGVSIVDITGCSKQPTAALFCVATDVEAAAYQQATIVIAKMGGKGNLVFLAGEPTDPNTIQREDGINKAIAQTNGAVKLLQVVAGIDSPTLATPAIQSLLAGKAAQIDGIVSTSYYPSVAGAEIWMKNPQYQRIVFAAADNSDQVMQAVQSGAIYGSMFQDPEGQGIISAYMLNKIVKGGCKVNNSGPWTKSSLTDKLMATGFRFIDKSSVAQYVGKPYGLPDLTKTILATVPKFLTCS